MDLHNPSCPSPGPVGSIKLQDPPQASVFAYGVFHCRVFFRTGLSQLLPDLQHSGSLLQGILIDQKTAAGFSEVIHDLRNGILGDAFHIKAGCGEKPFLQLSQAVRVGKSGDLPCFFFELFLINRIKL